MQWEEDGINVLFMNTTQSLKGCNLKPCNFGQGLCTTKARWTLGRHAPDCPGTWMISYGGQREGLHLDGEEFFPRRNGPHTKNDLQFALASKEMLLSILFWEYTLHTHREVFYLYTEKLRKLLQLGIRPGFMGQWPDWNVPKIQKGSQLKLKLQQNWRERSCISVCVWPWGEVFSYNPHYLQGGRPRHCSSVLSWYEKPGKISCKFSCSGRF